MLQMVLSGDAAAGRLAELNTHLEELLDQIMKETDPAKYDELGAEIWRVLEEKNTLQASNPGVADDSLAGD